MISAEFLHKFIVVFAITVIVLVYGSLFSTLVSKSEPVLPEKCTSGCPIRRKDGDFLIKNVVECLYSNGDLYRSVVFLGDYVRVCEIEYRGDREAYTFIDHRIIMH